MSNHVHRMQQAYRCLVESTSFPGTIADISALMDGLHVRERAAALPMLLALTLLDAEVTFASDSDLAELSSRELAHVTYARPADAANARFLFVCHTETNKQATNLVEAIERAHAGTLADPHRGATVIGFLPLISLDAADIAPDDRVALSLSGPGIDGSRELFISGPTGWIDARATRNSEFPLGIDLLLGTSGGRLISIPRTTQIEVKQETEATWAT